MNGALTEGRFRNLMRLCGSHPERSTIEDALRTLLDRSSLYVKDTELRSLETFARRMRGEIFFGQRWMIVEGQADYLVAHAIARGLDYDLDEHGVSVIDAQNNGSPEAFAVLARALAIPWLAVFDGDDKGYSYLNSLKNRGFDSEEIDRRCRTHGAGDLEGQFLADGLGPEVCEVLSELGVESASKMEEDELLRLLREKKTAYAALLAVRIAADPSMARRAPRAFRDAIHQLRGLT